MSECVSIRCVCVSRPEIRFSKKKKKKMKQLKNLYLDPVFVVLV